MCGVAGLLHYDGSPVDTGLLDAMGACLRSRGPDDVGFLGYSPSSNGASPSPAKTREPESLAGASVGLLHRRLSILDLSEAGWQPMSTPDGRYHIVFNGEIYNYIELRYRLKDEGYIFSTGSDTEVLLAGYAHWGSDVLTHLVGMFAFAILDIQQNKLLVARDFFGIKPLYYTHSDTQFAFASEIKSLLKLPAVSRKADTQRVYDYLTSGLTNHGDRTLFAEVRQLPAAHYLEIALDTPQPIMPIRYWQLDLTQQSELSFDAAADRLRTLFLESVKLHLRSDVPVGAALSGGIDSSAIVSAMRHLEPDLEIHTFSYIAEDSAINEERWVDIIGAEKRTIVHKIKATPEAMVADLDALIHTQDEPFGSSSIYAQHRVFRLANENGIKVMLDGQGADEILGGYRPYLDLRLNGMIQRGEWMKAITFLRNCAQLADVSMTKIAAKKFLPQKMQRFIRSARQIDISWLNSDWFVERGILSSVFWQGTGENALRDLLYQTLHETSVPMLLRYEDRNSMAYSLESRVPFLTPAIAEFVFSLPEDYVIDDQGTTKAIFRKAMRGIVPDAILNRQDKIGFSTPEKRWLMAMSPWVEATLNSETAQRMPMLNIKMIQANWAAVLAGEQDFNVMTWRWLNLIRWAEMFEVTF